MRQISKFIFFGFLVSCSIDEFKNQEKEKQEKQVVAEPATEAEPNAKKICKVDAKVNTAPQSIQEFLKLINALPKPVTGNCILEVLKRPIAVNATANKFSAQGATSERAPRIFIRYGKLILSFVGMGDSSKAIELAEEINGTMSIKGDIPLPVKTNLLPTDPFKNLSPKNSPACAEICHTEYKVVKTWDNGVIEYASSIVFPKESLRTTLEDLKMFRETCVDVPEEKELCEFYKALFDQGEVKFFEYKEAGK